MIHALFIPLPLAETDDVVKIVIGVVFALLWLIAQAVSSMGAKKKADAARQPRRPAETPFIPPPPDVPAQSYDELRRQRQQQAQRRQQPVAPPPRPRKPQRPSPRRQPAPGVAPVLQELAEGLGVRATEIGSENARIASRRGGKAGADVARVRAMLQPRSARDVILAAELLSPPVALRQQTSSF